MIPQELFIDEITTVFSLSLLALVLAMALTPVYTHFAYKHKWWKQKRTTDATGKDLEVIKKLSTRKRTVPTMAGLIVIASVTFVTLLFNWDRGQTYLPLLALLGGGFVGLIDDLINVRGDGTGKAGLRVRMKLGLIVAISTAAALFFYYKLGYTTINLPWVGDFELGLLIVPLFVLAVVSTGNAVNISDGRDGLAGGLLMYAYSSFGVIALLQGNYGIAVFCGTVVGALVSYLWFNISPARFFMGDVGSFSLGMALGVVAMLTDTLFLLPIIGLVFVAEAGSSLIQILSKKLRGGKRIFIAAPIHHHFEAQGWSKDKVTMRFWVVGQVCGVVGIILALIGGY